METSDFLRDILKSTSYKIGRRRRGEESSVSGNVSIGKVNLRFYSLRQLCLGYGNILKIIIRLAR